MKTKKRKAWVLTWERSSIPFSPNMPKTPPGEALAVFPPQTSKERIEGALVGMLQAFTSEYPTDMFDQVTKKAPYTPVWNWNRTFCEVGSDPIVKAYRVDDLQLDTDTGAGEFTWTQRPAGPRPPLS